MNKYLGKWYPIFPNAELKVIQLDCLDEKYLPPVSQNHNDEVESYLNLYNYALDRFGYRTNDDKIVAYNNSFWYVDEADSVWGFIEKMMTALNDHWERRKED